MSEAERPARPMSFDDIAFLVMQEVRRACLKHPSGMHSHHEAHSVILEELDEYWDEVKKGGSVPRDPNALRTELVQTAAMCFRALAICEAP